MDEQFLIEAETLATVLDEIDYYNVLRVPYSASPSEIKKAYYRESRTYHPDRFAAQPSAELRNLVGRIYRRVNEAYTVLRDDQRRSRYLADVRGPNRKKKLRFTEAEEAQVKEDAKKRVEEQLGQTPNGRKFYSAAMVEVEAARWESAGRALRSALMFEPENPKFKELLAQVDKEIEKIRPRDDTFRIK